MTQNSSKDSNPYSGYFDWAATAPTDNQCVAKALNTTEKIYANPSSVHKAGLEAKQLLTEARERCAKALAVKPQNLIFTSGGTESDYIPMLSLLQRPVVRSSTQSRGNIIISAIEHSAVREQAEMMKNCGFDIITVKPEKNGIISVDKLLSNVNADTLLVCVMAVNNETGCIQPVYKIADELISKTKGHKKPKFHVDAVQTIGKIPFFPGYPGIDTVAFSGHKIRAMRGTGLLYMSQRQEVFIRGGEQENGLRPGTENVLGALTLADCLEKYALTPKTKEAALKLSEDFYSGKEEDFIKISKNSFERFINQISITSDFINELKQLSNCTIIPERPDVQHFSPWVVQAAFSKIPGEVMVRALSEKGFYISTGSACSIRKMSRPVLESMGISKDTASKAVRFSFGWETSVQDIQNLITAIKEVSSLFK